jgi:hypothetical protein
MTVSGWIGARTPEVPAELAAWLTEALGGADAPAPDLEALARVAGVELRATLDQPGHVREAAFRLLTADGLLTHACEAAADGLDPEQALRAILAPLAADGSPTEGPP